MPISKGKNVFRINFLPINCYDKLVKTIHQNGMNDDEFATGGFTVANAKTIHAPAINEAFPTMECTLKEMQDLSGAGITAMVIGQVQHISVEESYAQGYEQRYGKKWIYAACACTAGSCHRGAESVGDCHRAY